MSGLEHVPCTCTNHQQAFMSSTHKTLPICCRICLKQDGRRQSRHLVSLDKWLKTLRIIVCYNTVCSRLCECKWAKSTTDVLPSVLWCCWLGDRKGIWPVKKLSGGMLAWLCLGQGADLRMAQLMPLTLTISCSSKSRLVLPSWFYLSSAGSLGSPGQSPRGQADLVIGSTGHAILLSA